MLCQALPQRGFIGITGEDARNFLQGIVTNDVFKVTGDNAVYSCFLTPQGKYLADFFIYSLGDGLLLEVDKSVLPDLLQRLTMYKLRSKVVLADVSDRHSVTAVWHTEEKRENYFTDPRAPNIGFRALNGIVTGEQGNYAVWQMQHGLPDINDFQRERTTMLEANMDLLNGVSFEKGCYMGQEITARMHYRAKVKKRFLPVRFDDIVSVEKNAAVEKDGKNIGLILNTVENYAIASLTLEDLHNGDLVTVNGEAAIVQFPDWFKLPVSPDAPRT